MVKVTDWVRYSAYGVLVEKRLPTGGDALGDTLRALRASLYERGLELRSVRTSGGVRYLLCIASRVFVHEGFFPAGEGPRPGEDWTRRLTDGVALLGVDVLSPPGWFQWFEAEYEQYIPWD
jgi:hypothetical protein